MRVLLVEPQIASNTGSIIRLCANAGAELHLVEPLGFTLDDSRLRRGGLDYHEYVSVVVHPDLTSAREALPGRWLMLTSRGATRYDRVEYRDGDVVVFGSERFGLPDDVITTAPATERIAIPMRPGNRSLNLANAVSVVLYEAWRQLGFDGAGEMGASTRESLADRPGDRQP